MGCKAVKDGDDNYLSINCYYEVGREDQKNYCLALVKKWDNPKDIKYVIKENPGAPFRIAFKVNGREHDIQNTCDNSESTMNATLQKAYDLIK